MEQETDFQAVHETKKKKIKKIRFSPLFQTSEISSVKFHESASERSVSIWDHDKLSFRTKRVQTQPGRMLLCWKWYQALDIILDRTSQRSKQHQRVFSTHDAPCKSFAEQCPAVMSVKCGPSLTSVGRLTLSVSQPAVTKSYWPLLSDKDKQSIPSSHLFEEVSVF